MQQLLHILPTSRYKLTDMPQLLERAASPPSPPHLSCWFSQLLLSATPDHRNSPLDIQIPALPFRPACMCCLFAASQTTAHLSAKLLALSTHLPSLSCFSPPADLITGSFLQSSLLTVLSLAEFSAVHNSSLHKCSSLTSACSPSAPVPHLPLPFPHTALSPASYISNGFKGTLIFS